MFQATVYYRFLFQRLLPSAIISVVLLMMNSAWVNPTWCSIVLYVAFLAAALISAIHHSSRIRHHYHYHYHHHYHYHYLYVFFLLISFAILASFLISWDSSLTVSSTICFRSLTIGLKSFQCDISFHFTGFQDAIFFTNRIACFCNLLHYFLILKLFGLSISKTLSYW